jgi:hypothetical protein
MDAISVPVVDALVLVDTVADTLVYADAFGI